MKKFRKIAYVVLIVIIVILSLTIYTNASKKDSEDEGSKIISEIKFIESKLVDLLNKMNGIETRNYKISYGEITEKSEEESGGKSSSGDSGGSENKTGGSESTEQEESSSQESNSSSKSSQSSKTSETKFEFKMNGVLSNSNDTDWENIKLEIENLYTSVPTITMDLYKINVNQDDILAFNKEYDNLVLAAKDEDKEKTLEQLSKLYDYIPKFINNTSSKEIEKKAMETKSNIFKAYSKLDTDNWNDINNDVNNAINSYSQLLSDTNIDSKKQYSINRIYILLNELKNSATLKDKDVFLIKYKKLLEEIDAL